jgi:hypothetical protein
LNLEKIGRVLGLVRQFQIRAGEITSDAENEHLIVGTAATGALRRTSMELTRALTDLRRPG